MKNYFLSLLLLAAVFIFTLCYHDADLSVAPQKPPQPGPEFKCSHDTIFFYNSVLPVILTGCAKSGCHDEATQKGELVLDNYYRIREQVIPFDPENSELYIKLFSNAEGRMPPDTPLDMVQKSIIYWWISQGAFNNRCDSIVCDSANVTYTISIQPILQTWCLGCHSGSNPSNGLSLTTYDETVACANSGRLMGALRHEQGYFAMPKGGYTLSPCEIDLFQKWINIGKPE
jgi:hypothetical protein